MKLESGAPVVVEDLGSVKDWFRKALEKAAIMRPGDVKRIDEGELSHIELATIRLCVRASQGCLDATKELLDRVMGKSKQYSESTNVNLTLDDVLKQMSTVDVE